MIAFDTNFLVRHLTQDDLKQAKIVARELRKSILKQESVFITQIVLVETAWVLQKAYKIKKEETLLTLIAVVNDERFTIEDIDSVTHAIENAQKGGDFADHLIAAVSKKHACKSVYTFDRSLTKSKEFKLF